LSYQGKLFFGVTGDYATVPNVGVLAAAIPVDIAELRDRALVRIADKGSRRARAKKAD
jgi:hypothetical protein